MEFTIKTTVIEKQRTACIVVGVFEAGHLSLAAKKLDKLSKGYISKFIKSGDIKGKAGQALILHNVPHTACERVLLVGCGKEKAQHDAAYRKIVVGMTRALVGLNIKEAVCYLTEVTIKGRDTHWKTRHLVESARASIYRFDDLKRKKARRPASLRKLVIHAAKGKESSDARKAAQAGQAIANGVELARDLGNLPGNICTPTYLANQAKALVKKSDKIKVQVLNEDDMKRLKMGALLSVSRGSRQPAKLITLKYSGGKKGDKPVILVGKGVTFDSGGISIKPAAAMDEMKYDMCGAASVLGTLTAVAELDLPINVVGVIPSTENLPDGDASKPGDIVTSMSGQTIEVLNTDAEGRLILCDALTYCEKFKPAVVIDIATLTGSCVIALGQHASGLLGNYAPLTKQLLDAGTNSGDRAWELPLWDEYQPQLHSNFADMANIGGREAGTITAACFLSRFTKKYHWAHIDIAGAAWLSGKAKGATGRPVPLLTQYLLDRCAKR